MVIVQGLDERACLKHTVPGLDIVETHARPKGRPPGQQVITGSLKQAVARKITTRHGSIEFVVGYAVHETVEISRVVLSIGINGDD